MMDRDLRIIQIIGSDKILIDSEPLAADNIVTIRQQLRLENRVFQLLLIGKDGTVKLRSEKPVSISDIFGLIDSMPMRQQEMRKKSGQS